MLTQNKIDAFEEFAKAFAPCNDVQRGYVMGYADAMKRLISLKGIVTQYGKDAADYEKSA